MPSRNKRTRFASVAAALAMVLMASGLVQQPARAADPPPASASVPSPRVRVTTSMGEFVMELYPDRAPLTVANFLRYVGEGQYTNTLFHRVITNFVIQGGGHSAVNYQLKPVHEPIPNESGNGLQNKRGMVGLARGNAPHTGDCQFYINLVDNPDLDPVPTRWGYAVFGRVVEGMGVIEKIGVVPTGAVAGFKSDAPLQPIMIQKVEVIGPMTDAGAPPSSDAASSAPPK